MHIVVVLRSVPNTTSTGRCAKWLDCSFNSASHIQTRLLDIFKHNSFRSHFFWWQLTNIFLVKLNYGGLKYYIKHTVANIGIENKKKTSKTYLIAKIKLFVDTYGYSIEQEHSVRQSSSSDERWWMFMNIHQWFIKPVHELCSWTAHQKQFMKNHEY